MCFARPSISRCVVDVISIADSTATGITPDHINFPAYNRASEVLAQVISGVGGQRRAKRPAVRYRIINSVLTLAAEGESPDCGQPLVHGLRIESLTCAV